MALNTPFGFSYRTFFSSSKVLASSTPRLVRRKNPPQAEGSKSPRLINQRASLSSPQRILLLRKPSTIFLKTNGSLPLVNKTPPQVNSDIVFGLRWLDQW
jgi:hypothetical protein